MRKRLYLFAGSHFGTLLNVAIWILVAFLASTALSLFAK
jgi:hypothetical protein